jgi:hypothetical protein
VTGLCVVVENRCVTTARQVVAIAETPSSFAFVCSVRPVSNILQLHPHSVKLHLKLLRVEESGLIPVLFPLEPIASCIRAVVHITRTGIHRGQQQRGHYHSSHWISPGRIGSESIKGGLGALDTNHVGNPEQHPTDPHKHLDLLVEATTQYRRAIANIILALLCVALAGGAFMYGHVVAGLLVLVVSVALVVNAESH